MIYLELFLLTAIVVFIVDLSDAMWTLKHWLSRWLGGKVESIRPFDCSLCMTWWVCLIYALCVGEFTLPVVAYTAFLAYMTTILRSLMELCRDALVVLIRKINNLLSR